MKSGNWMRHKLAIVGIVSLLVSVFASFGSVFPEPTAYADATVPIVQSGVNKAVIVVSTTANSQVTDAANKLAGYVQKATGVLPPIATSATVTNSQYNGLNRIYVGMTAPGGDAGVPALLSGMDGDGFVINPEGSHVTVIGAGSYGTEFGVDEFLERYVGVRWLMPSDDGEDVPFTANLTVTGGTVSQQPAFIAREFDPYNNPTAWARNNRMYHRLDFTHNLKNLFPYSTYHTSTDAQKKAFVPSTPPPNLLYNWQPCFTAPGIVDEAIKNIKDYFAGDVTRATYSLSVNDGGGFCQTDLDYLAQHGLDGTPPPAGTLPTNSIGFTNMSNIYFNWVEQVVEGVLQTYPDKTFGVYAYRETYDPPTNVTLNSHIYVFITDDRLSWKDPIAQAAGHDITERWHQKADSLGFYEYLYGSEYMVPRMYNDFAAETLRYAAQNGVKALYSELYPNWGEGPKPWVMAKLQWNPNADVAALENEWYTRAVGAAAVADLKAYYDHWEQFWTERVFDSLWYQTWFNAQNHDNFMKFNTPSYLELVTPSELADSRALLESVVQKAVTPAQKRRANALLSEFEYYEASALSYPKSAVVSPPANDTEAIAMLDDMAESVRLAEKRIQLTLDYKSDPILKQAIDPQANLNWTGISGDTFPVLVDWLKSQPDGGATELKVRDYALNDDSAKVRDWARLLLAIKTRTAINHDPSFELAQEPTGTAATFTSHPWEWSYWKENITGNEQMNKTTSVAHTGSRSLDAQVVTGGPIQYIPSIEPGRYGAVAYLRTASGTENNAPANADFETGTTGVPPSWTCTGSCAIATDRVHGGTRSVKLVDSSTTAAVTLRSAHIPVTAGELYQADVYNYNASGRATLYLEFWNSSNVKLDYKYKSNTVVGSWQSIEVSGYAPPNAAYATLNLNQDTGNTGTTYFDDVSFVRIKQPKGTANLTINLYDANTKLLGSLKSDRSLAALRQGRWSSIQLLDEIPVSVGVYAVDSILLSTGLNGFSGSDNEVFVDDVSLFKLDDVPAYPLNGDFESVASGKPASWTCGTGNVCQSDTNRHNDGTTSVKLVDSSNTTAVSLRSGRMTVIPGEMYHASVYNDNESGSSVAYLEFWNSANTKIGYAYKSNAAVGAWNLVEVEGFAPAGTAYATVNLTQDTGNVGTTYFDSASVVKVPRTVDNGDFENGTMSWTCSPSAACSSATDTVFSGANSAKLTDTSSTTAVSLRSAHIPVAAGFTYKAKAYAYNQAGSSALYLEYWNSSGTKIGYGYQTNSTTGAWKPLEAQLAAPAGTDYATVQLNQDTGNIGTAYFDKVTLELVP